MLTLDLPAEPYWLDLPRGVRVEIRPVTRAVMAAAQAAAARRLAAIRLADPPRRRGLRHHPRVGGGARMSFADDNKTRKIGYVGGKRYVRLTVTPANNTGNIFLAAIALLGHPRNAPTPNPPV